MANIPLKIGNSYTATKVLTTEADQIASNYEVYTTLIHEFGDTVVSKTRATRTNALNYSQAFSELQLNSAGVHKIKWEVTVNDEVYVTYDTIDIYTPYTNNASFFEQYPYLDNTENDDQFDSIERKVRNTINTFCGQTFDFYINKTLTVDGSGSSVLPLALPLLSFSAFTEINTQTDETDTVEILPDSLYYLRYTESHTRKFIKDGVYQIVGDWGWQYVPDNIKQAADLLIADTFNDDNAYRTHGVTDLYMDTHRMRIDDRLIFDSTGNIDADVLLMDYTRFIMSYV